MDAAIDRRLAAMDELIRSERPKSVIEVLAIQRQIEDLRHGHERGLRWDETEAARNVAFFKELKHWKGKFAGTPMTLEPWQEHCIIAPLFGWMREKLRSEGGIRRFRTAYIEIPRKNGKQLDLNTPVPTPDGWKTVGELRVGDMLFDERGQQCRITDLYPVQESPESYELEFSNGERIKACSDHLWVTSTRVKNPGNGRAGIKSKEGENINLPSAKTTRQIYETQRYGVRNDVNHSVAMPGPLNLPDREFLIHPYALGAWLGDGHTDHACITCSEKDWFIVEEIAATGEPVKRRKSKAGIACASMTDGKRNPCNQNCFQARLRTLGVLGNKHIPPSYLRASIRQRTALLQGLMDTDGTVAVGGKVFEYVTKLEVLAEGVCELLSSLGIKWRVKTKYPRCNGRLLDTLVYSIQFCAFRDELQCFRLPRKLARMRSRSDCKTAPRCRSVQIVSVKPCAPVPMRCLTVDSPTHQFLVGRTMLPTHNTTIASGIGNQGLIADMEPGAEVYAAATKRDQASILFKDAQKTLGKRLRGVVTPFRNSIVCPRWNSTFMPLSSDYNSLDGLNVHRAIVDEVHAHKTRHLWDVLDTATGARSQPLLVAITTAGFDRSTICWELHELVRKILERNHEDDAVFGFIATIDNGDDWLDPLTWWKANPNLHVSLNEDVLIDAFRKAQNSPQAENNVRRKHLDQWTEQEVRWLQMDMWDRCCGVVKRAELQGQKCFAGLDLASTRDVNSFVLLFPTDSGFKVLPFYWVPEEAKDVRANQDRTQVMNWADRGFIKKTPGNTTDYATVCKDIMRLSEEFRIEALGYDPTGPAASVVQMLEAAGFPHDTLRSYSQGWANFALPTKEFERLLLARKLEHGNDPVLRWMAGNATVKPDANDNIRPDKSKSADKIDGIVASIMALGLAMQGEAKKESIYETRGILEVG